ncbi:hypothetical protein UFOVP67_59 [uncultured Caudovirales phage]|uniref:Uncharacterized protein n=1 Tax=uncultured Caudovirales phage TaxID=2100421 RepID=A0A6J5T924_9CAUD|nr:hypothetical protein UFOVP67_59 [uncultured Caudovirales phage]
MQQSTKIAKYKGYSAMRNVSKKGADTKQNIAVMT